jgi:hypothetical protein
MSAIRLSLEAGLYTAISTIGSRDKLSDGTLERLANLAAGEGVHEFRILEPIPTGRFSREQAEILTADESRQLAWFIRIGTAGAKGRPLPALPIWSRMICSVAGRGFITCLSMPSATSARAT